MGFKTWVERWCANPQKGTSYYRGKAVQLATRHRFIQRQIKLFNSILLIQKTEKESQYGQKTKGKKWKFCWQLFDYKRDERIYMYLEWLKLWKHILLETIWRTGLASESYTGLQVVFGYINEPSIISLEGTSSVVDIRRGWNGRYLQTISIYSSL